MTTIVFKVFEKEWQLNLLSKKHYHKKYGKDSVAETQSHTRSIDIADEEFLHETIVHELVHVFFSELCIGSCTKMHPDDVEEFAAEVFSKYGKNILALADFLYAELTDAHAESVENEVVHFVADNGTSPCGNLDPDATVANSKEMVTCLKCLEISQKELN